MSSATHIVIGMLLYLLGLFFMLYRNPDFKINKRSVRIGAVLQSYIFIVLTIGIIRSMHGH